MTHNEGLINNKSRLAISAAALLFCLVWALVGEADIKIIAVSISFMFFIKYGIDTEMSSLDSGDSH